MNLVGRSAGKRLLTTDLNDLIMKNGNAKTISILHFPL